MKLLGPRFALWFLLEIAAGRSALSTDLALMVIGGLNNP